MHWKNKVNIQEMIDIARKDHANNPTCELKKIIINVSLKTAFSVTFDKYFPNFSEDSDKPEILAFNGERYDFDGHICIGESDTSAFLDDNETELYCTMNAAEDWTNANIEMILALAEKQILAELEDQDEIESVGL